MSVALLLNPRSPEGPRIVGPFDHPDDAIGYIAGLCLESPEYRVTWSIVPIISPDPDPPFPAPNCSWCSRPIRGEVEVEAGRAHHANGNCPAPPRPR